MENNYKILIINYYNSDKLIPKIPNFSWNYQNDTINLTKFSGKGEYIIISINSHVVSGIKNNISIFLFELFETEIYNEEIIKIVDFVIIIFDENTFSKKLVEIIRSYNQNIKIIIFNNKISSHNKMNRFTNGPVKVFDISLKSGEGIKKGLMYMINYFMNLNSLYKEYD